MRRCESCGHAFQLGTERCAACGNPLPRIARAVPEEELLGAYQVWERLELLAPTFGVPGEVLTLEHWHVAPGDIVEPGEALARIARADGSTVEQRASDRMRVIECLIPSGGLMEPKSPMLVLGPVTPENRSGRPTPARTGCATLALSLLLAGLAASLLLSG